MLNRHVENGLLETLHNQQIGCIVFSPLQKGILSNRYLHGIPADTRAAGASVFLKPEELTPAVMDKVSRLNTLAEQRGQSLAQLALAWVLRHPTVTSALIGASRVSQIEDAVAAVANLDFSAGELSRIDAILQA